jgi:diguanylate cyclase (GGDEF)-like protein
MHLLTNAAPQKKLAILPLSSTADSGSKLAHRAFWIMTRRVTLVAAGVDLAFFVLFLLFHSPLLAWLNVLSLAMYGGAYWLLSRRKNVGALVIIWLEVLGHSAIGSMLVGWDSGFHYFLLMFIPAIVISRNKLISGLLFLLLLMFYLGLHAVSRKFGVLAPLSSTGLSVVHAFNVAVVFAMAGYTARFYYGVVRRAERKLLELATRDSLSGLFNRHHLLTRAEREIVLAKRSRDPITLIIADIDHFKQVNDRYGHTAGDHVIAHAGKLLLKSCRSKDIVSRWGGEEFLLLLPATDVDAASSLADRICQAVEASSVEYNGSDIRYTLSIGVTRLIDGEALNTAIARADLALYQSKERGRNCVTVAA